MGVARVTVEADEDLIRRAERLALARNTTVDAMLRRLLVAAVEHGDVPLDETKLPPITRSALGLLKGATPADDRDYKEILADALFDKYEANK
ncbi:MAG TPA: hypothetical protein VGN72_20895 [Tepidisphaeraceae bacterium]|jgi:hypothetical protein|nr:hypothetical protein [Tepidisphaeraceae bacterium]